MRTLFRHIKGLTLLECTDRVLRGVSFKVPGRPKTHKKLVWRGNFVGWKVLLPGPNPTCSGIYYMCSTFGVIMVSLTKLISASCGLWRAEFKILRKFANRQFCLQVNKTLSYKQGRLGMNGNAFCTSSITLLYHRKENFIQTFLFLAENGNDGLLSRFCSS